MSGGGQPKNTTTTTETKLPPWLAQQYQNYFGQVNAFNNKPYTPYGGQTVADPNLTQIQALLDSQNYAQGGSASQQAQQAALQGIAGGQFSVNPGANPYMGQTTNVGTNPYAGQNDYLNKMVDSSNSDITRAYNNNVAPTLASQFAQGGAFGGSAMQSALGDSQNVLARNIANSTNDLRFRDYTSQQGLAENALNRSVQAQQNDLARNSGLYQQGVQNNLQAAQQNAGNILSASQGITGANALQSQFLGQYSGLANQFQQNQQAHLDDAYNRWYQQNYGYDQSRLNTLGDSLNSFSGNFRGSQTTGNNPAYSPRTLGGGVAAGAGGAAAGGAIGAAIAGGAAGSVLPGWGTAIGAGVGLLGYYL